MKRKVRYSDGAKPGAALFLAQFMCGRDPWTTRESIAAWMKAKGFVGVQLPTWEEILFNLKQAAESAQYFADRMGPFTDAGISATHLSTHPQGQLVCVNPALQPLFEAFVGPDMRDKASLQELSDHGLEQNRLAVLASANAGLKTIFSFPGAFAWPTVYPWPQRPFELIRASFMEMARRWRPIWDLAAENGIKYAYEVHPGEDVFDGMTLEMFLEATGHHEAVGIAIDPSHFLLQGLDYMRYIDKFREFIFGAHWKDGEFVPNELVGAYGGYSKTWKGRAGRFRSLGDGMLDLIGFQARLDYHGLDLWKVLEWECCIKGREQGATEGAQILNAIEAGESVPDFRNAEVVAHNDTFDDFAGLVVTPRLIERTLGFKLTPEQITALGLSV